MNNTITIDLDLFNRLTRERRELREALEAIKARIHGEYDNPYLEKHGFLSVSIYEDILKIAKGILTRTQED